MAVPSTLFGYNRELPKPFKSLCRVSDYRSEYSDTKRKTTLSPSLLKAMYKYALCQQGNPGALGRSGDLFMAEYPSSVEGEFHLVVYDAKDGGVTASVYNTNEQTFSPYLLTESQRDGSAILMALLPVLLKDKEFSDQFKTWLDCVRDQRYEMTEMDSAILSDNAYRRIQNEDIPLKLPKSGTLRALTVETLQGYRPRQVLIGRFTVFNSRQDDQIWYEETDKTSFAGKYALRPLKAGEAAMELDPGYVLPAFVPMLCRHIASAGSRMRNILLRGPSGTGKTSAARALSAGLNLPYRLFTCSTGTEEQDLLVQFVPQTQRAAFEDINLDDLAYDPAGVYEQLTGERREASIQDCFTLLLERAYQTGRGDKEARFMLTESPIIQALRHGELVEIQEPSTIQQPGVLVKLNDLLEGGAIQLPTGETVRRHPDAVVVVTTNVDYEGCRAINQSIIDRMDLIIDLPPLTAEELKERAMRATGFTDEGLARKMAGLIVDIAEYCQKNSILDGVCGLRGLMNWMRSARVLGDPYQAALATIVGRAATDPKDREAIRTTLLDPVFTGSA